MNAMASATSRPQKTVDDYMALGDEVRAELIAGEIYMAPSPRLRHQFVSVRLLAALDGFVRGHKLGQVLSAPSDVHLPSGDVVQPDLLFVANENASILQDWVRGVPDLLVEIVSPSHAERDRIIKRALYARNGVPEYWIVDPADRTIEVLRLAGGTYGPAGYFGSGTVLETAALSGLQLEVCDVFAGSAFEQEDGARRSDQSGP